MLSQSTLIERFSKGAGSGSASNVFVEEDVIYSYGHHFPLAVRQDWGGGIRYLINGDRYSSSTASHQSQCIRGLTPNVQVPFSALAAAGLADSSLPKRSLRIAACRDDDYRRTCKHCGRDVEHGVDGSDDPKRWNWYHAPDCTPLCAEADGETASHHVLGAVVLAHEDRFFLSSIDEAENWRTRAYFLCRLPRSVSSVSDAYEALVPDEVRTARATGIEVRRQGDIFAIATARKTRQIRAATQRHLQLFDTTHVATEARLNGAVYIRGTLRHIPEDRPSQHGMLRLGTSWWIAVKNLALGSWNAVGTVD